MGNAVKVIGKPEASVVGEIVSAEIENQIATAKQYPRDVAAALDQLEKLACRSDAIAESCMYTLKRKDKGGGVNYITGPSVRFAELLAHCWGNLRAGARIIEEGDKAVVAQGIAYDLERNTGFSVEIRRGITTSSGGRFGQDMINVTSNAACSIALRNAIFDCVPQSLWSEVYEAVKAKAIGAAAIPERLQGAVKFFVSKGATQEDILKSMGVKSIAEMGRDHLEIFIGLTTAMKEGTIDAAKIFTDDGAEQRRSLSLVADDDGDPNSYSGIDKLVAPKDQPAGKEPKAGKKAGDAPKDAAAKGDGVESGKPATDPGADGSAATAGDPQDNLKTAGGATQQQVDGAKLSGEPGDAQGQTATAGAGESSAVDETDEQLVARIEAEVKAARYVDDKKAAIKAAKGALEMIRQTGEDEAVVNRASALLKKFDLSK